jgi:hypothetical protein
VSLHGRHIGWLGELHPQWRQSYELPLAPVLFELDLDALQQRTVPQVQAVSRLQPVERDWEEWQRWLTEGLAQLDRLPDWTLFQEASQKLEGLQLGSVVKALGEDRLDPADLPYAIWRIRPVGGVA